jgi:hypothetical protein
MQRAGRTEAETGREVRRAGERPIKAAAVRARPDGVDALARWENEGGSPGTPPGPTPPATAR